MVAARPVRGGRLGGRAGFTLVEVSVATTLGTLLVLMVLGLLQAQADVHALFQTSVIEQDAQATAAEYVLDEVRSVPRGGMIHARPDSMAFRRPLVMGQVCASSGYMNYIYFPLDGGALETARIGGGASQNPDGTWSFLDAPWSQLGLSFSTTAAAYCAARGTDTTGVRDHFAAAQSSLDVGTVVMLYQVRQLFLKTSQLDSTSIALFTGGTGESVREVASGLGSASRAEYRHRFGYYLNTVSYTDLQHINGLRFTSATPDAHDDDWTVEVRMHNAVF